MSEQQSQLKRVNIDLNDTTLQLKSVCKTFQSLIDRGSGAFDEQDKEAYKRDLQECLSATNKLAWVFGTAIISIASSLEALAANSERDSATDR